jgi:hypothetical protein
MSSKGYAPTLHVERRPSRRLIGWLWSVHAAAAMAACVLPVPPAAVIGLLGLVAGSLYRSHGLHGALTAREAITGFVLDEDGDWYLTTAEQSVLKARLLPGSVVHPRLIVLTFAVDGRGRWDGRRSVVLVPDGGDPRSLRKLRVRLRLAAGG